MRNSKSDELDATQPMNADKAKKQAPAVNSKKRAWVIAAVALAVVAAVLLTAFIPGGWLNNKAEPPLPTQEPTSLGVLTPEEYEELTRNAQPGDAVIDNVNASRSAAGWAVQVGLMNVSSEDGIYTVQATSGEEVLGSADVEVPFSSFRDALVYLDEDFDGGDIELTVTTPAQEGPVASQTFTVGTSDD